MAGYCNEGVARAVGTLHFAHAGKANFAALQASRNTARKHLPLPADLDSSCSPGLHRGRIAATSSGANVLRRQQKQLPTMKSMTPSDIDTPASHAVQGGPQSLPAAAEMQAERWPFEAAGDMAAHPADQRSEGTLPVIEEMARVQVVEVDQGGWRISKKVSVTEQQVDEELKDFSVQIERRPMGIRLEGNEVPEARYEGNTLVISVVEEVLVTEKRLVLVEEVRITGTHGTHRAPQQVSLRKETVSVERLAPEAAEAPAPGQPASAQTSEKPK